MKKFIVSFLFGTLLLGILPLTASDSEAKRVFEDAKLKLFDREWKQALEKLTLLTERHPDSRYYQRALFYKGRCFEELKKYRKGLNSYQAYLQIAENKNLIEEAKVSIIDISAKLSKGTDKTDLIRIVDYLDDRMKMVRYYAAFKLSYLKNKRFARKGIPVLKKIITSEDDDELIDRARLSLMRIDPKSLPNVDRSSRVENADLFIRVTDIHTKKVTFSFNVPFVLAKLGLELLKSKEKKLTQVEGYDIDSILRTIVKNGEVFKLRVENIEIHIWIK